MSCLLCCRNRDTERTVPVAASLSGGYYGVSDLVTTWLERLYIHLVFIVNKTKEMMGNSCRISGWGKKPWERRLEKQDELDARKRETAAVVKQFANFLVLSSIPVRGKNLPESNAAGATSWPTSAEVKNMWTVISTLHTRLLVVHERRDFGIWHNGSISAELYVNCNRLQHYTGWIRIACTMCISKVKLSPCLTKHHDIKIMGEWRYSSTYSLTRH